MGTDPANSTKAIGSTPASLFIVATPIGNLGDITQRAIAVLKEVSIIAAEDTRHSAKLLSYYQIDTPMISVHEHNEAERAEQLVQRLRAGSSIALISDAGTPLISDPGYRLVKYVRAAGFAVVPVPGACAAIAALSAGGLPTDRFVFEGFLAAKSGPRDKRLHEMAADTRTLVFYESPRRVLATVQAMASILGPLRQVTLARELTKSFETLHQTTLAELANWIAADTNQQRGEVVLLVEGAASVDMDLQSIQPWLDALQKELPASKLAAIAAKVSGLPKKVIYQHLID